MEMNSKIFLKRFFLITVVTIAFFISINIYVDIYGLFLGRKNRKVYVNERTSKYLFSFRYIPENFDGIIIGPSLSANLDPRQIDGFTVYNSSIMGANISELHYLIDNIQNTGSMKLAIICLDPYLTKDFGKKSAAIDPKEYYGALGSTNLLRTYLMYAIRTWKLLPNKYAAGIINENGRNNFELEMKNIDPERTIEEKVKQKQYEKTDIDPRSYNELKEVISKIRSRRTKIVAYFSPIPHQIFSIGNKDYLKYQNKILQLFTADDIVIDLNNDEYKSITSDYKYYIDHGHLSAAGQTFVLNQINARLESRAERAPLPVKSDQ